MIKDSLLIALSSGFSVKRLFVRKIKGDYWTYLYHTKEVVR
jgi:hypothetical protein